MKTLPMIDVDERGGALPPCRHRSRRLRSGAYRCRSSRVVGLALASAEDCRECVLCDHAEDIPAPALGRHFLPCAHWGTTLDGGAQECDHPRHGRTTWEDCQSCDDYLFPFLSPEMPDRHVERLLELGPRGQLGDWWHFSNVQRAYRRLARRQARALTGRARGARIGQAGSLPHGRRGIVIAGGGKYYASAYVTVRVLRHVGCELPVELWHLEGEMDGLHAKLLEPFGVTCINADEVAKTRPFRFLHGHWWKGWQLKAFAIANSQFDEVLFLDADSYPTRDPSFLFDLADYRRLGAIFWPDIIEDWLHGGWQVRKIFGVQPPGRPLESGQLLINKKACPAEMRMTLWYNARADYVYHHLWGDKDTFAVAWTLCGRQYFVPWPRPSWDTHTILQYDPDGAVLFQHRCRDKFRVERSRFDSSPQNYGKNHFNASLAHEAFCFDTLEELKNLLARAEVAYQV